MKLPIWKIQTICGACPASTANIEGINDMLNYMNGLININGLNTLLGPIDGLMGSYSPYAANGISFTTASSNLRCIIGRNDLLCAIRDSYAIKNFQPS